LRQACEAGSKYQDEHSLESVLLPLIELGGTLGKGGLDLGCRSRILHGAQDVHGLFNELVCRKPVGGRIQWRDNLRGTGQLFSARTAHGVRWARLLPVLVS
jgi:hypothetical protein